MDDTIVLPNDSPTLESDDDLEGPGDAAPQSSRIVRALKLLAGLALLAWTLWKLQRGGALGTGAVYLGFTSFVFLGTGHLALRAAGVEHRQVTWLGLRYVVGFALSAFLITLAGSFGFAGLALWLALAVGVAGWSVGAWELLVRHRPRPSGSLVGGELLVGAALLRVAIQGSTYWRGTGATSHFTQYHDLLYHLALVKNGIDHGLPLRGWVLESGVPNPAYHPAFDTMTSVLLKGLGLPVDAAFFRLVLPVAFFGMLVGIGVLAAAWGRSRRAGLLALGFVALAFVVTVLPQAVVAAVGDVGLNTLRYFVYNPPSALAVIAGTACLAAVALAEGPQATGAYILAGLLAGATTLMKANFAVVLVPAFALALAIPALRRRPRQAAACGIAAAALAVTVSYPTTRGQAGTVVLGLGRLGAHLAFIVNGGELRGYSVLFTKSAGPLDRIGAIGDALLVLLYIAVVPLGWWLIVTVLATWRARAAGAHPFARSPAASRMVLAIVCLTTLVALFVAQRGVGYLSSWNVTWHTIQNLWWLAVCAAAVALDAALRGRPARVAIAPVRRRPRSAVAPGLVVVAAAVLLAFSLHGATRVRQGGDAPLPSDLRLLLQGLDARVPASARVVQDRDTRQYNWVSALTGREVVLERSSWTQWLYPARTVRLEHDIATLYATRDPATARRVARDTGAGYAVIDLEHNTAPGLRAIGSVVMRQGAWALLRLH